MWAIILLVAVFTALTVATPTLSYPFNSQVPPVARSGQYYNYTFPANTFSNYLSDVVYTLAGNPQWLSIDSATRTLEGLPSSTDVGTPTFTLIASDSTGSATDSIVLVVSGSVGPYVAESLESQLAVMGLVDGSGGLILKSDTDFAIKFSADTFADTGGNVTAYYGTSDNYTPLPSWITFDIFTITFTGTTPTVVSTIAPPMYFSFVLVGTDYPGFAGISATFQIIVGLHQLSFATTQYTEYAEINEPFSFSVPLNSLILDNVPIEAANISSITANTTGSWLSFDDTTYTLSGTPGSSDRTTDIAISAIDVFGDMATTNVLIELGSNSTNTTTTKTNSSNSTASIFTAGALPTTFDVVEGTFFSYTFNSSVLPATATLNVTITNTPWLHYNPSNKTLYGEVPSTNSSALRSREKRQTSGDSPAVTITASQGGQTQTQTITVTTVPSTTSTGTATVSTTTTTSTPKTATASPSASSSTAARKSSHKGLSAGEKAGIAVVLIAFILLLIAMIAILYRSRCFGRLRRTESMASSPSNISRPIAREKDEWPQATRAASSDDEPHQIDAFQMFKSNSDGRLSGYAVEINHSGMLAAPLAPLAHELPPLPESPSFDAVRSAYTSTGTESRSTSLAVSSASRNIALSENNSIVNIHNPQSDRNTIKPIINARRSALQSDDNMRNSTQTMDTVSTDELFSVRLVGTDGPASALAPPLVKPEAALINQRRSFDQGNVTRYPFMRSSETQHSGRTIGTYTSSEGDYIQRYASQGESLSSNEQSHTQLASANRQNDTQAQPWRVLNSEESYDSFGSYATTDSNLSDEFSFDGSQGGHIQPDQEHFDAERGDMVATIQNATIANNLRERYSNMGQSVLLAAPLSPDWSGQPSPASVVRRPTLNERVASFGKGRLKEFTAAKRPTSNPSFDGPASVVRRPTLNERVASFGKGRLKEFTAAKRPTSNPSFDGPDMSVGDTTGSSAEIAFV